MVERASPLLHGTAVFLVGGKEKADGQAGFG
jgi:hypothetical protein